MRADLDIIKNWIPANSRVLDVGCGEGELLAFLAKEKNVQGYGIENDHDNISTCIERGVNVIEKDIDEGLNGIKSQSFDTVIMTQAIQA
ncbi:MAG: methionine biosynthesis protein MetW, partial [Pontibacterium sp.]